MLVYGVLILLEWSVQISQVKINYVLGKLLNVVIAMLFDRTPITCLQARVCVGIVRQWVLWVL